MLDRLAVRLSPSLRRRLRPVAERLRPRPEPPVPAPRPRGTSDADGCADADALAEISLGVHDDVWTGVVEARPSYTHKLHEARRTNRLVRSLGSGHPMWAVNAKTRGYRLAASLGIDHPRVLAEFEDIAEIDPGVFGPRLLVKPVQGSTNRGVSGLVADGDGRYRDLLSGRSATWSTVVRDYAAHVADGAVSAAGVVEELLAAPDGSGSIPDDWKVYVFGGRAVVTMQRRLNETADRSLWRFRFWTREWRDLGAVKFGDRVDPTLPPPVHGEDLVAAADRLGAELDVPFVRLDFYDTDRGVVFGEVTPHPGPPEVWDRAVDEILGRHWELAEARATVADIARGRWSDLERYR